MRERSPALLHSFFEAVREELGHPASLCRMLAAYPHIRVNLDDPVPCIHAGSVPRWHELGKYSPLSWPRHQRGSLMGWHTSGGVWQSFSVTRPEYAEIARCKIEQSWTCDVTDIDGFAASKADLSAFATTDAMAEARCQWLISEVTLDQLAKSLAHKEIRIIHNPGGTDHFGRYLWDGRLWLMNDGGSHHTAAAKYLAARLGQRVPLRGRRYTYSLNALAIASLRRDYEMFAINCQDDGATNAFAEAMRAFRATWLWHPLPRPYEGARAVLLPRDEGRSMRVAVELRSAGVVDLGAHLTALCARQHSQGDGKESLSGDGSL